MNGASPRPKAATELRPARRLPCPLCVSTPGNGIGHAGGSIRQLGTLPIVPVLRDGSRLGPCQLGRLLLSVPPRARDESLRGRRLPQSRARRASMGGRPPVDGAAPALAPPGSPPAALGDRMPTQFIRRARASRSAAPSGYLRSERSQKSASPLLRFAAHPRPRLARSRLATRGVGSFDYWPRSQAAPECSPRDQGILRPTLPSRAEPLLALGRGRDAARHHGKQVKKGLDSLDTAQPRRPRQRPACAP